MGQEESHQDKGPFSDEEFAAVVQQYRRYAGKTSGGRLSRAGFEELFKFSGDPEFARQLFRVFKQSSSAGDTTGAEELSFAALFEGVSNCSRASDKSILRTFFGVLDKEGEGMFPYELVPEVFRLAYQMTVLTYSPDETDMTFDGAIYRHAFYRRNPPDAADLGGGVADASVSKGVDGPEYAAAAAHEKQQEPPVTWDEFYQWMSQTFPLLYCCFGGFIYSRVCPGLPIPPTLRFRMPQLGQKSLMIEKPEHAFGLAAASASLQGEWERLYFSAEDGLSFNRVCHHVLGYRGPNLFLLRDTKGYVFGFFTMEAWKEANTFYGSSGCFLFRLLPELVICRPKYNSNHHFMYLNLKGYSLSHGLGVGGDTDSFRFFIPEGLENCKAAHHGSTFESGPLASSEEFELEALQVWGVGGIDTIASAMEAQGKSREHMTEMINRARKVDKAKFAGNEFDREMLLGKTFGGGSAAVGVRNAQS